MISSTEQPKSSRSSRSRSSSCACTVTSSAVVGSSATIRPGPAGDRDGRHHPLPQPAGELVRIDPQPQFGVADPDGLQQPHRFGVVVGDLADLPADPHGRVQRRHRVLEDRAEHLAAHPAQLGRLRAQHVDPADGDRRRRPADAELCGSSPSRLSARTLLPEPDSPTRPRISPGRICRSTCLRTWLRTPLRTSDSE